MNIKKKPCKSMGKSKGFQGCGELQFNRKFGLGVLCGCYSKWLLNTPEGQEVLEKGTLLGKKKAIKEQKKKDRDETAKKRLELISPDKYRAKYVQPLINKIARLIDYGNPCTPTGNFEGKMAGGHYTSVGANRTICLNLHNIFIQSFHSNSWKGGDDKKYRAALKRIFGADYLEFIEGLNSHRSLQLRKPDLIKIKEKALVIIKVLEADKELLSAEERIEKRNNINLELGIYDVEYCKYEG
ncbi:MAG: recombination protein NinG [Flavobacteriaceae bacterium]